MELRTKNLQRAIAEFTKSGRHVEDRLLPREVIFAEPLQQTLMKCPVSANSAGCGHFVATAFVTQPIQHEEFRS